MKIWPHCGAKLTGALDMRARKRYLVRRRRGLWHEKGAEYVARLLAERGPFHGLDLASKAGGGQVFRQDAFIGRTGHGRRRA